MDSQQIPSPSEILDRARALHEQVRTWRREIHRYPELTFDEHRTAGLVASTLSSLGIDVETEVAKTGVVGQIRGGNGPTVGLRADMDALPIEETNGTDFDSIRPGIMHACGHDAHTAILLGAATLLKQFADEGRLPGNVRLLFQPSEEAQDEEGKSGGMRMTDEGALRGLDAVFGLHVSPIIDVGTVATRSGPITAAFDNFDITVIGSGGHAARPQTGVDPIVLSAHLIMALQQIVSRRVDPLESGVVTVGTIHGGTVENVIPDKVKLSGTLRSYTPETRQLLRQEVERACGVVEALGGSYELSFLFGYPPTINSEEATETMVAATQALFGEDKVGTAEMSMGAEDFSYMAQEAPGCFLRLGTHDPSWDRHYMVHRADFRMDEDALPVGVASLAAAAVHWMQTRG
jgi:IAA-amino acid hydrolase